MTTPRPDETGPSQNSSYRDTRSSSLQRIVRRRSVVSGFSFHAVRSNTLYQVADDFGIIGHVEFDKERRVWRSNVAGLEEQAVGTDKLFELFEAMSAKCQKSGTSSESSTEVEPIE